MSIQHLSRMGKWYQLHAVTGKSGKIRYHFSTKKGGLPVQVLPEGYEIYEDIKGQVFLRRKTTPLILDAELNLVRQALKDHAEEWRFKVEVKKDIMVIHEAGQNLDILDHFPLVINKASAVEYLKRTTHYMAVFRFILTDREKRLFRPERFCFRGSVDDWVSVGSELQASLPKLLKKYIPHLGKESIYELY